MFLFYFVWIWLTQIAYFYICFCFCFCICFCFCAILFIMIRIIPYIETNSIQTRYKYGQCFLDKVCKVWTLFYWTLNGSSWTLFGTSCTLSSKSKMENLGKTWRKPVDRSVGMLYSMHIRNFYNCVLNMKLHLKSGISILHAHFVEWHPCVFQRECHVLHMTLNVSNLCTFCAFTPSQFFQFRNTEIPRKTSGRRWGCKVANVDTWQFPLIWARVHGVLAIT